MPEPSGTAAGAAVFVGLGCAVADALGRAVAASGFVPLSACTARTVDAIWHAAGDRSADFSWYTKRAILAAVYTATVLYWRLR